VGGLTSLDFALCFLEELGYSVDGGYQRFIDLFLLELLKLAKYSIHPDALACRRGQDRRASPALESTFG
jgi:hypothetical protein